MLPDDQPLTPWLASIYVSGPVCTTSVPPAYAATQPISSALTAFATIAASIVVAALAAVFIFYATTIAAALVPMSTSLHAFGLYLGPNGEHRMSRMPVWGDLSGFDLVRNWPGLSILALSAVLPTLMYAAVAVACVVGHFRPLQRVLTSIVYMVTTVDTPV